MFAISRFIPIITLFFMIILANSEGNLNKEEQEMQAEEISELIDERLNNLESEMDDMNKFQKELNEEAKKILEVQAATSNQMEQLQEMGKKIHVWSDILKKFNEYVTKGNDVLIGFNDKVSSVMTKMVGFEEQMKAIASLDTLVVCILSLVLVKIFKDEFMDEGYQPVGDSTRMPMSEIPSSGVLGEHEIAE